MIMLSGKLPISFNMNSHNKPDTRNGLICVIEEGPQSAKDFILYSLECRNCKVIITVYNIPGREAVVCE